MTWNPRAMNKNRHQILQNDMVKLHGKRRNVTHQQRLVRRSSQAQIDEDFRTLIHRPQD